MKICKECGLKLPYENFTKSKNVKDGYENKCKKCRNKSRLKHKCICKTCGKEWKAQNSNSLYCSPECKPQSQLNRVIVKCSICGCEKGVNNYRLKHQKDFYCSDECKNKGYSLKYSGENSKRYSKKIINCDFCNKEFKRNPYEILKNKYNYCSFECRNEHFKERFSKEGNPLFGKKRLDMRGSLNHSWNPNRTNEERKQQRKLCIHQNWTRDILKSHDYTCQCCSKIGGNLVAHHIDGYNWCAEKRTDVNNGATLCTNCHKEFHKIYKYGDNTRQQYIEFINRYANTEPSQCESIERCRD